jgi:hypothetical protein
MKKAWLVPHSIFYVVIFLWMRHRHIDGLIIACFAGIALRFILEDLVLAKKQQLDAEDTKKLDELLVKMKEARKGKNEAKGQR